MNDKIIATGEVSMMVYENDKLIEHVQEKNLVVTLGKTNITKLLGGAVAGKAITKISLGNNPNPAVVGDTAITTPFTKALSSVSYPDPQSVQFNFEIENSEANGLTIQELGLLNVDNILFARKIRDTPIVKTNVIRLVGTWKITVN